MSNDNLIRAVPGSVTFRSAADIGDLPPGYIGRVAIRFSPVNEWAEIKSVYEGHFLERFAPNAWKKTIRERVAQIKSLFQHGMDPQVGDKPLGPIHRLLEDDAGGFGEVDLLDTSYNRDLVPGLKAGLYGASHQFRSVRYADVDRPDPSDHNPDGIRERTIKEAQLFEFGPVTFPAYAGATAGMRSMTDEFLARAIDLHPDRVRALLEKRAEQDDKTSADVQAIPAVAATSTTPEAAVSAVGEAAQDTQDPEAPSTEPLADVEPEGDVERRDGEQDAPSKDNAETKSHLVDERRDTPTTKSALLDLYGRQPRLANVKESRPSWHR